MWRLRAFIVSPWTSSFSRGMLTQVLAQFEDDMLRREFNMVAVDLRGFGETGGKPGDVYDVGCAAQDIARIIVRRVSCSLQKL